MELYYPMKINKIFSNQEQMMYSKELQKFLSGFGKNRENLKVEGSGFGEGEPAEVKEG